jgi:multidrug efflux system outer membrane protein
MKSLTDPAARACYRASRYLRIVAPITVTALLAGCAIGPDYARPDSPSLGLNAAWQAPPPLLPHQGKPAQLVDWWRDWNDPVLAELIAEAQTANSNVQQAAARIVQSRASYQSLTSVLLPSFTANAADIRSKGGQQAIFSPSGANEEQRSRNASLDAAWELDLFGGGRRGREAGRLRLAARSADWHEARVSVAAEVAAQYVNLRTCEVLLTGYELDAKSRSETARLTVLKRDAGLESPANAALAQASSSEAAARLADQRGQCEVLVKVLAELTGVLEPTVRSKLASGVAKLPTPAGFSISAVPAELLSQRPDLAAAERDLAAAMSDIGVAMADRLPRLRLTGSVGYLSFSSQGISSRGREWNWGPALSLPIFDAGKRAAEVRGARARYDEALATYQGKVRRAVREVEEALVRLDSANKREADANAALQGYQQFLRAAEARVKVGAGSLPELEEARRSVVAAQGAAVGVARERLTNWIALYKAVGGGWQQNEQPAVKP